MTTWPISYIGNERLTDFWCKTGSIIDGKSAMENDSWLTAYRQSVAWRREAWKEEALDIFLERMTEKEPTSVRPTLEVTNSVFFCFVFLTFYVFGSCFRTLAVILVSELFFSTFELFQRQRWEQFWETVSGSKQPAVQQTSWIDSKGWLRMSVALRPQKPRPY